MQLLYVFILTGKRCSVILCPVFTLLSILAGALWYLSLALCCGHYLPLHWGYNTCKANTRHFVLIEAIIFNHYKHNNEKFWNPNVTKIYRDSTLIFELVCFEYSFIMIGTFAVWQVLRIGSSSLPNLMFDLHFIRLDSLAYLSRHLNPPTHAHIFKDRQQCTLRH